MTCSCQTAIRLSRSSNRNDRPSRRRLFSRVHASTLAAAARARIPKVRRLAAGGNWIRTSGSARDSTVGPPAKLTMVAGRSSLVSTRARRPRSGGGSFGFVLFGEPFHRAGLPYGLGGLRFATLLRLPERGSGNGALMHVVGDKVEAESAHPEWRGDGQHVRERLVGLPGRAALDAYVRSNHAACPVTGSALAIRRPDFSARNGTA